MDAERIKKLVLAERETVKGKLKAWWANKYKVEVVPFEKRTIGGLIREYFEDAAVELSRLRAQILDGRNAEAEERISELEALFSDSESDLRGLTDEQSLAEWTKPRSTGDPKVDEWEAAIARGEIPDLED